MISVDAIGCSYVHSRGWEINRPQGLDKYLFIHIETPADIMVGDEVKYYENPCYIMYKKGQKQFFHNHEKMTYIDSWVHFSCDQKAAINDDARKSEKEDIRGDTKDGTKEAAKEAAKEDTNEDTKEDIKEDIKEGTKEYSKDEIEILLEDLNIPCAEPVVIYNTIELSDLWHLADSEFHQSGKHKKELLDMKMRALIYKFADIIQSESATPSKFNQYRKAFGELRNSIFSGNNAAAITDITRLATSMNMSLSYFEHVYKELFHVPVSKDIIKSRTNYARYLLRSTNNTIQDIAQYCGYENVEHFNRQFKATVGYTPTQFRNQ